MRQISKFDWTCSHDDQYSEGQLVDASVCYSSADGPEAPCPFLWPWSADWWHPSTERRNKVKAAALMLAEIERLDRAEEMRNKT